MEKYKNSKIKYPKLIKGIVGLTFFLTIAGGLGVAHYIGEQKREIKADSPFINNTPIPESGITSYEKANRQALKTAGLLEKGISSGAYWKEK